MTTDDDKDEAATTQATAGSDDDDDEKGRAKRRATRRVVPRGAGEEQRGCGSSVLLILAPLSLGSPIPHRRCVVCLFIAPPAGAFPPSLPPSLHGATEGRRPKRPTTPTVTHRRSRRTRARWATIARRRRGPSWAAAPRSRSRPPRRDGRTVAGRGAQTDSGTDSHHRGATVIRRASSPPNPTTHDGRVTVNRARGRSRPRRSHSLMLSSPPPTSACNRKRPVEP